jgi:pimeloyl-ACP methyl ester carboxylesterase
MISVRPRLRLAVWSIVLSVLLSACFRQTPPTPQQPIETPVPVAGETPLVSDVNLDNATKDEGHVTTLDGAEDNADFVNADEGVGVDVSETTTEISAQAVLPNAQGYVVYGWYSANSATTPWRVYRHDEVSDVATLIYGGLREINSVAVSGDGNKFLVSMRETSDAASDFEIFQITLNPTTVTQLTSNTVPDTNVSMSVDASKYVWETDGATAGVRNVVLRNNSVAPATTTTLSPAVHQYQPSITNDGKFIALMRRATTGAYQIYRYELATNLYTLRISSTGELDFPSFSNDATKVLWYQKVVPTTGSIGHRLYIRDLTTPPATTSSVLVVNNTNQITHAHLTADGNFATYALFVTTAGRNVVYNRDIVAKTQVTMLGTTANLIAPYWQQPDKFTPVSKTIGATGGFLNVSGQHGAQFEAGFLSSNVSVTLRATPDKPTTYPSGDISNTYDLTKLKAVGYQTVVEIPMSAVNLTSDTRFFITTPPLVGTLNASSAPITEIRITKADGSEHFLTAPYQLGKQERVEIQTKALALLFPANVTKPQVLKISIQPVDTQYLYSSPQAAGQITAQGLDSTIEGMYRITGSYDPGATAAACPQTESVQQIPPGVVPATPGSVSAGKTPVIIVHGWTGLPNVLNNQKVTFPGVCSVQPLINEVRARGDYEIYVYSYDPHRLLPDVVDDFKTKLAATFGNDTKKPFILGWSTGGYIALTYQEKYDVNRTTFTGFIPISSPLMGSELIGCLEATATACTKAQIKQRFGTYGPGLLGVFKPRLESDYGPAMASFAWAFPDFDTIGGTCFAGPFCVPPYVVNYVANPAIPSRASLRGNYSQTTTVYSDGGGLLGRLITGFIGEGKYANDTFITNISSCYGDPAQTCAQSSIFGKDLFIPGFNHGTDPDVLTNMSDEIVDELCVRAGRCPPELTVTINGVNVGAENFPSVGRLKCFESSLRAPVTVGFDLVSNQNISMTVTNPFAPTSRPPVAQWFGANLVGKVDISTFAVLTAQESVGRSYPQPYHLQVTGNGWTSAVRKFVLDVPLYYCERADYSVATHAIGISVVHYNHGAETFDHYVVKESKLNSSNTYTVTKVNDPANMELVWNGGLDGILWRKDSSRAVSPPYETSGLRQPKCSGVNWRPSASSFPMLNLDLPTSSSDPVYDEIREVHCVDRLPIQQ